MVVWQGCHHDSAVVLAPERAWRWDGKSFELAECRPRLLWRRATGNVELWGNGRGWGDIARDGKKTQTFSLRLMTVCEDVLLLSLSRPCHVVLVIMPMQTTHFYPTYNQMFLIQMFSHAIMSSYSASFLLVFPCICFLPTYVLLQHSVSFQLSCC